MNVIISEVPLGFNKSIKLNLALVEVMTEIRICIESKGS